MRPNNLALTLMAAAIVLAPLTAATTVPSRSLIATSQDHSLVETDDCAHFHTSNVTSLPSAAHAEERRDIQLEGSRPLRVRAANEGGVSVRGWDRPFARVTICKSAMALTDAQAKSALSKISVAVSRDEIMATGPVADQTQTWWVHMILQVPKTANLDVSSANGGIAIRNMSGRVIASATNGGISLASCAGESDLKTSNGGISLDKISGSVRAVTQNGPISLKVRDAPLTSLEASTEEQGEILCNLKGCADGLGNWTLNRKHLRIGSAAPQIRLTSYNADIMIEQVR